MSDHGCYGLCQACGTTHTLGAANARYHALQLMAEFEALQRLDFLTDAASANPKLAFDYLFQLERGHMFGVLECRDAEGKTVVLRAFSSLYGGVRNIPGWVGSLLAENHYQDLVLPAQALIKQDTAALAQVEDADRRAEIFAQRKRRSQELFAVLPDLYLLHNFSGQCRSVREVYPNERAMPGGVGECCAPKLLCHAAQAGLTPVDLAEFYWGGLSGNKRNGEFYPSCEERCRPILGFVLCGLDD